MRILQVHNFYQQPGGEDRVLAAENSLMTSHGYTVTQYTVHNDAVNELSLPSLAAKTIWNGGVYRTMRGILRERLIQVVHVHNTLPLISPAVYYAAAAERIPVVQTLHNYRLLCPAATFFRDGAICEQCQGKRLKYPAVVHRCYRGSRAASAAVATMLAIHGVAGTWRSKVHTYIALSEFAKRKFVEGGLPASRIQVKPNFLSEDPGIGSGVGDFALCAGRLTDEKGIENLLAVWERNADAIPLLIAGDGPLREMVERRANALPNVTYLGSCSHERIVELLKAATILVFPSEWYEGLPLIVIEAMACGTPVAAYGLGSLHELISDGENGFRLPRGDLEALFNRLDEAPRLRLKTRAYFERHFQPERNFQILADIYRNAALNPFSLM